MESGDKTIYNWLIVELWSSKFEISFCNVTTFFSAFYIGVHSSSTTVRWSLPQIDNQKN